MKRSSIGISPTRMRPLPAGGNLNDFSVNWMVPAARANYGTSFRLGNRLEKNTGLR